MPRHLRIWDEIRLIGVIWMPAVTCAQTINVSAYDRKNIGEPTRDNVESWLGKHASDFQSVTDFAVDFGTDDIQIPWEEEESELTWSDCTFPETD